MQGESETLFLPARNEVRERYTGRKLTAADADAPARTGFAEVAPYDQFLKRVRETTGRIQTVTRGAPFETLKLELAGRDFDDLTLPLARLRMVKSPSELARIQYSVDATVIAHRAAWARLAPGLTEFQIAATTSNAYFERGCERHAYPPIVASGPNNVILHYSSNKRRIDAGELLLMDAGAECAGYAADLTRTVPVNGRFTARQREVYDAVLEAQEAAIEAAKPGMFLTGDGDKSLNTIAKRVVEKRGLGKYYLHGLGHMVGLDVHDAFDEKQPLAEGMVLTIEPGVYIAEEGFGVRIEDMILITRNGAKLLSGDLPRQPAAIEKALKRR
jgi:Xaa-Pro aminopeptidase